MTGLPRHAELIDNSLVAKTIERPSKYLPGVKALAKAVQCPACSEIYGDPGALKTISCKCGLYIRWESPGWHIWRDEKVSA